MKVRLLMIAEVEVSVETPDPAALTSTAQDKLDAFRSKALGDRKPDSNAGAGDYGDAGDADLRQYGSESLERAPRSHRAMGPVHVQLVRNRNGLFRRRLRQRPGWRLCGYAACLRLTWPPWARQRLSPERR